MAVNERIKISPATGFHNFSSASFHLWATHYYKCVQDFQSLDPARPFSPVPYALLSRAIELELKSRLLEITPGREGEGKNTTTKS